MVPPCSPGRTRTYDPVVNSHLLYRLSYRGMCLFSLSTYGAVVNPDFIGTLPTELQGNIILW